MPVAFYDPTNPRTREFVWELIEAQLPRPRASASSGWTRASRSSTPAHPANLVLPRRARRGGRQHLPARQRPPLRRGHGRRTARTPDGPAVPLRLGRARRSIGAAVWSGDIPATWDSLRQQVRAGLNIAIAGIPWWTTDIGGFHGGDPRDPAYQRADRPLVPVRRVLPAVPAARRPRAAHAHRLRHDRRPERGVVLRRRGLRAIIADVMRLRERLRPYLHEQMRRGVADTGCRRCGRCSSTSPTTRAPGTVEDEFMFGPDMLVAPVLEPGARDPRCLPARGRRLDQRGNGEATCRGAHRSECRFPLSASPSSPARDAEVLDVVR